MGARVWPQPMLVRDVTRSRDPDVLLGNGVLLWFELAKQRELRLRDPDGSAVVLAGESEYRPRS